MSNLYLLIHGRVPYRPSLVLRVLLGIWRIRLLQLPRLILQMVAGVCHHDDRGLLRYPAPPLGRCLHLLLYLIELDRGYLPLQHRAIHGVSIAHFKHGGGVDRVALDGFCQLTWRLGVDGCGVEGHLNVLFLADTHLKGPSGLKRGLLVLAHLSRIVDGLKL